MPPVVARQTNDPVPLPSPVGGASSSIERTISTCSSGNRASQSRRMDEAPPTSSFPSGHTAATIALWGSLAVLANERARSAVVRNLFLVLGFVVPVVVASSRMYRGMHYLSDVLGGMLLGGLWLLATVRGIRLGVAHWAIRHGGDGTAGRPWRRSAVRHG